MAPTRLKVLGLLGVLAVLVAAAGCSGNTAAPADVRVTVYLGLARDAEGLAAAAASLNDPASADFGSYLTVAEVADRYGASGDDVGAAQEALADAGVAGTVDPSGGFIAAELTVAQAEDLLDIEVVQGSTDGGTTYVRPLEELVVPDSLSEVVTEVVGISRTLDPDPGSGSSDSTATDSTVGDRDGDDAEPEVDQAQCAAAQNAVVALHDRYGIDTLHDQGHQGAGATVAVLSLDIPDMTSLGLWASCLGKPMPDVATTMVGSVAESTDRAEIDVDLATLDAVLPEVGGFEVLVFDQFGWIGAPIAAALALPQLPDAISTSVGFCEADLTRDAIELGEWVLATAAAVGVTAVASAGDDGASSCVPASTDAAVQYPASSAWVVSVGGTQLADDGPEIVWLDSSAGLAGGGGFSQLVEAPAWQLTPDGAADAAAGGAADQDGRRVPDVAALAAPSQWPPIPICSSSGCSWAPVGGTSAAAPLVAAGLLLADESRSESGAVPVGLWTPILHAAFADGSTGSPNDVTDGSNDLNNVGCCEADTGADPASGLGTIDFAALAEAGGG